MPDNITVPGIITIEITGIRSKQQTLKLTYKQQSKSVGLNDSLYLDELAKILRELANWLESLL